MKHFWGFFPEFGKGWEKVGKSGKEWERLGNLYAFCIVQPRQIVHCLEKPGKAWERLGKAGKFFFLTDKRRECFFTPFLRFTIIQVKPSGAVAGSDTGMHTSAFFGIVLFASTETCWNATQATTSRTCPKSLTSPRMSWLLCKPLWQQVIQN